MWTRGQASSEIKIGVGEAQELEGSKCKQGMGLIVVQPQTFHFDGGVGKESPNVAASSVTARLTCLDALVSAAMVPLICDRKRSQSRGACDCYFCYKHS
jgi:hypothetical protein